MKSNVMNKKTKCKISQNFAAQWVMYSIFGLIYQAKCIQQDRIDRIFFHSMTLWPASQWLSMKVFCLNGASYVLLIAKCLTCRNCGLHSLSNLIMGISVYLPNEHLQYLDQGHTVNPDKLNHLTLNVGTAQCCGNASNHSEGVILIIQKINHNSHTVNPDKLNQLTLNMGTVLWQCK